MTEKILAIDDNLICLDVLRRTLDWFGYCADFATTPAIALDLLNKHEYALILIDIQLQNDIDGFDLTRLIRSMSFENNALPIIATTAYTCGNLYDLCMEAGLNGLLMKPFRVAELEHCLKEWLG